MTPSPNPAPPGGGGGGYQQLQAAAEKFAEGVDKLVKAHETNAKNEAARAKMERSFFNARSISEGIGAMAGGVAAQMNPLSTPIEKQQAVAGGVMGGVGTAAGFAVGGAGGALIGKAIADGISDIFKGMGAAQAKRQELASGMFGDLEQLAAAGLQVSPEMINARAKRAARKSQAIVDVDVQAQAALGKIYEDEVSSGQRGPASIAEVFQKMPNLFRHSREQAHNANSAQ